MIWTGGHYVRFTYDFAGMQKLQGMEIVEKYKLACQLTWQD